MFPLRDNIPSSQPPYVNYLIIAANLLIFFWELSLGPHLREVATVLGFVPGRFLGLLGLSPTPWPALVVPLFSSFFLHAGWLHLLGNMWFLYIFGDNVEDLLGHGRYLVFYLACGVAANFVYLMFSPWNLVPLVGASGAIAGVMGAYFYLFPGARVLTLFLIIVIPIFVELPAYFFLGLWLLLQFFYGTFSLGPWPLGSGGGPVAWWAHVGGFLAGILFLYPLAPARARYFLERRHFWRRPLDDQDRI
jgi:membrane associated rhomboid family serine protease